MSEESSQGRIISIDEGFVKSQLSSVVRETCEETLNKMLDAEADELCGAKRYERSKERVDTRAGRDPWRLCLIAISFSSLFHHRKPKYHYSII